MDLLRFHLAPERRISTSDASLQGDGTPTGPKESTELYHCSSDANTTGTPTEQ